ncbi:hypothetical protein PG993_012287 [Apiospora rasikravindrae]|uniref:YCII-related domain-containing protein n=1 Tax=Apiospora rasikravindrae TaxID=990691 RepID=A0ABR1S1Y6_9PEZI
MSSPMTAPLRFFTPRSLIGITPRRLVYTTSTFQSSSIRTFTPSFSLLPFFRPSFGNVTTARRAMSSSSAPAKPAISAPPPGKFEFLVVVPDKPGMQAKRLEVRPKHFEGLTKHIESGAMKMGGAALGSVPQGDDPTKWDFAGSTVVMVAESVEEVRALLEKDIYTTSGVWDMEKVQIWPVKLAFRYP